MATPAFAEQPWWRVTSNLAPTRLPAGPGQEAKVRVIVVNAGDAAVNANTCVKVAPGSGKYKDAACTEAAAPGEEEFEDKSTVKITDTLPAGLEVTGVYSPPGQSPEEAEASCNTEHLPSTSLTCEWTGDRENFEGLKVHGPLQPFERIELQLTVVTPAVRTNVPGEVVVTGGEDYECKRVAPGDGDFRGVFCREQEAGAGEFEGEFTNRGVPRVSLEQTVPAEGEETPFGVEHFEMIAENEGGAVDTQAGSHPFQLASEIAFNQTQNASKPPASLKDVIVKLPPGLVGDASAFAQCTGAEFSEEFRSSTINGCPTQAAIGVAVVRVFAGEEFGEEALTREVPIFNLVPATGEPARFGFEAEHVPVIIDTSVRTGEDYGVTAATHYVSQAANVVSSLLTFWGAPGDPRHDLARGWNCVGGGYYSFSFELPACQASSGGVQSPLLTLPTSCTGPMETSVEGDSWANGNQKPSIPFARVTSFMEGLDGCNRLVAFTPSISVAPEKQSASTPSGLQVKVHVPQEADLNPTGLADAVPRDITVTLPEGVITNPAGAGGLESCSETQIGYLAGASSPPSELHFTGNLPEPFCPNAAEVGTVKITTPDLPNPLEGAVYLAAQTANPFGSLVALYIVAEDHTAGVLAKIPAEIELNGATGQIVTKVRNSPQVPFEEAVFNFFGGNQAPLATPLRCNRYKTNASFVPWTGNATVEPSSSFEITSGPHGSPCPGATLPFSPSLAAGTSTVQAGAFSSLTTNVSREDGNQSIKTVQIHTPTGLAGLLSGVKLCEEAQANAGTCGSESQIGETTVSAGVGGAPYTVSGGKVYLTGPYEGAPFGLSIASPAKAGPFDLAAGTACDCVVVRAKIEVNPLTAALTVTSNSSGPYAIPQILDGIPLEIKHLNVTINRAGFTFNPTNCSPLTITGNIFGSEGATSESSAPFEVANCATLGFAPKAAVSSKGKASKANGASLLFKITYPKNAMGSQSWLNEVKVDIPKQLPVRLSTIQKACLASVFESDRPACPSQSIIGHVVVHTPVIPVPLQGPIYFVSYGNKKFPEAVFVLKGYGITIEQHGETFIDHKTGVTSATFSNIPDLPVESIEASLPTGPFSEFTANLPAKDHYNLCGHKLVMPALFKGSNGAVIHTSLTASITGCPKKSKKPKKKTKKAKKT
jgi:hypothetical protein